MKKRKNKLAVAILALALMLLSSCRAGDCGCPMSELQKSPQPFVEIGFNNFGS